MYYIYFSIVQYSTYVKPDDLNKKNPINAVAFRYYKT